MIGGRTGAPRLPSTGPGSPITTARTGTPAGPRARSASSRVSTACQHHLRAVPDVDVHVLVRHHLLAQVEHGEMGAAGAQVGQQHVTAPRRERQPVRGPAAARGRPGAGDPQHAAGQQLVDRGAHRGAGHAGRRHQVGLAQRGAGRDQPGHRAEGDLGVDPAGQRRGAQPQRRQGRRESASRSDFDEKIPETCIIQSLHVTGQRSYVVPAGRPHPSTWKGNRGAAADDAGHRQGVPRGARAGRGGPRRRRR